MRSSAALPRWPTRAAKATEMTATQVEETEKTELASGRVARVIGPVVDVEFPAHAIPAIYTALTVPVEREVLKYKKYARPFLPLRLISSRTVKSYPPRPPLL